MSVQCDKLAMYDCMKINTGRLPLAQYVVTIRIRVGSTTAPINGLMLSFRISRIARISFIVLREISRRFEKRRSLMRTIVPWYQTRLANTWSGPYDATLVRLS